MPASRHFGIKKRYAYLFNGNLGNFHYMDASLFVPEDAVSAYQAADGWKNFWDIRAVESAGVESTIISSANQPAAIYDLQGRRLREPQKGINIVNGQKVVIK